MKVVRVLRNEPPRDRWGRIVLVVGQKWMEKMDHSCIWIIAAIEIVEINDTVEKMVYLEDLEGAECVSSYTEKYFRKWFIEINEPRRKENRARLASSAVPNLKHWIATGPVVSSFNSS